MQSSWRFILAGAFAIILGASGALGVAGSPTSTLKMNEGRVLVASDLVTAGSDAVVGLDQLHGFGPVGVVNNQDWGGEPGIDVAPDGTIYENAPSGIGNTEGSWLYKSTDGGATWTECRSTTGPGGGDSNVAISPDGTIMMNDLWVGSMTVYVSRDGCASWTTIPISTAYPAGDRQWVEYGFQPCEFFQSWNQLVTGMRAMITRDCGLTWKDVAISSDFGSLGNLVADHSGTTQNVYQFYATGDSVKLGIGRVFTNLAGATLTWTTRTIATQSGRTLDESFPAGAVDAAGNVHVVWQSRSGADSRIDYAFSSNGGTSWTTPRTISSGGSNVFPWIDAGAAGKVNAVWYHADQAGNPNQVAGPWYVHLAQSLTLGGAFSESRATPFSIHNDVICTGGVGCGGDDRDLLDFFEVAHDAQGLAVIAFTKDTDANGNGNGNPRNAFVRQVSGPGVL